MYRCMHARGITNQVSFAWEVAWGWDLDAGQQCRHDTTHVTMRVLSKEPPKRSQTLNSPEVLGQPPQKGQLVPIELSGFGVPGAVPPLDPIRENTHTQLHYLEVPNDDGDPIQVETHFPRMVQKQILKYAQSLPG